MKQHLLKLTLSLLLLAAFRPANGQDVFSGTWTGVAGQTDNRSPVTVTLRVASSEKGILYPAELSLSHPGFNGSYLLLLVRKSSRELAIGSQKYPVTEEPFSLGNRTLWLNGNFDLSRDYRENAQYLTAIRIPVKDFGVPMSPLPNTDQATRETAQLIARVLSSEDIRLKKTDPLPWNSPQAASILDPKSSPAYFGIKDTVFLSRKDGTLTYPRSRKMDNDTISLSLNGKIFNDQHPISAKRDPDDIILDTGVNILVSFADNYGKKSPNEGKVELDFGYKKWLLDFNAPEDKAAQFIVSRLHYEQDESTNTRFAAYFDSLPLPAEKIMDRDAKLLGNLVSGSHEITLALWDDAVEDGDTISLHINGRWVARDFPVLKKPQFIRIPLNPGPNAITFVANNLGSIPPNTAVLEIIDGRKRKSFMIDTDMEKNNLVRIFYDFKPGD